MARGITCEYADRNASPRSLKCALLAGNGKNRDFCKYQFFCPVSGNYELRKKSAWCELRSCKTERG